MEKKFLYDQREVPCQGGQRSKLLVRRKETVMRQEAVMMKEARRK
jgi:hypothetical protein